MFKNNGELLHAKRISKDISQFKDKESLYNEIIKTGYVIFDLSEETNKLLNDYGVENLRNDFHSNKDVLPVTKGPEKNGNLINSKYRKSIDFYENKHVESKFNLKLSYILQSIETFLMSSFENLNSNITNITSSILNSDAIPLDNDLYDDAQVLHTDYKIMTAKQISLKEFPLSVLIALEDDTVIRILLNSHNIFIDKTHTLEFTEVLLSLKKGQIFIFHPNLIHGGWSFKMNNIRLHLYLDNYRIFRRFEGKTKAWYLSDKLFKRSITDSKKRSLANLVSMNNNKKIKHISSIQNITKFNNKL